MFHKPVLTKGPKNITLVIGASTNLSCEILTDLHAHIEWSRGFFSCNDSEKLNLTLGKVLNEWHAAAGIVSPLLKQCTNNINNDTFPRNTFFLHLHEL